MSLRYREQYPIFHFSKFDFPSQKVIFWDIIFFIPKRIYFLEWTEKSQKASLGLVEIFFSIPKSVILTQHQTISINFFPNRKEVCPKDICLNQNIIVSTDACFLLCSIRTEIKWSMLYCSISFFPIRVVDNLFLYHSYSFEQLQTKPFFTVQTSWERWFIFVLYSLNVKIGSCDLDRMVVLVSIRTHCMTLERGFYFYFFKKINKYEFL